MTDHKCDKWNRLTELDGLEIEEDGMIQIAYVDYDDSWSYGYDSTLNFIYCPYCGEELE